MLDSEFENFIQLATEEKSRHHLHTLAQQKLTLYLCRLYPHDCIVPEVSGVLGGRNDLMLFFANGRRVVFEFFFSPSQVPQDLRLLEQAVADVKIAILIDRKVKPKLAQEYLRKKPNHFPFFWLSDLMMSGREAYCLKELSRLIDEDVHYNLFINMPTQPATLEQVKGTYDLEGKITRASMNKAQRKMMRKIERNSNGSVPVSFSFSHRVNADLDEAFGDITVQY